MLKYVLLIDIFLLFVRDFNLDRFSGTASLSMPLPADYNSIGEANAGSLDAIHDTINQNVNYYADLVRDPDSAKELLSDRELSSLKKYEQKYPNNIEAVALAAFRDEQKRQAKEDKTNAFIDAVGVGAAYTLAATPVAASFIGLGIVPGILATSFWNRKDVGHAFLDKLLEVKTDSPDGSNGDTTLLKRAGSFFDAAAEKKRLAVESDKMLYMINGGDISQSAFKETRNWAKKLDATKPAKPVMGSKRS